MSVYSLGHFFNWVLAVFLRLYYYFVKRSLSNPCFFILLCFSRAVAAIQSWFHCNVDVPSTINGSSLRNIFAFLFQFFRRRTMYEYTSIPHRERKHVAGVGHEFEGPRASRMRASTLPILRFPHSLASQIADLRVSRKRSRSRCVGLKRRWKQKNGKKEEKNRVHYMYNYIWWKRYSKIINQSINWWQFKSQSVKSHW